MNNQMANMAASMNTAGGPVGGATMMGNPARSMAGLDADPRQTLNTYIYDYFIKSKHISLAKAMLSENMKINFDDVKPNLKDSNGVGGMDIDKEDLRDLPAAKVPHQNLLGSQSPEKDGSSFLLEWWCQFWDIYAAARGKPGTAQQYLQHVKHLGQMRENPRAAQMMMGSMNQQRYNMMQAGMVNGVNHPTDLKRAAAMNRGNPNNPNMAMQMKSQGLTAANMQRDGSGMDMNGQRPQSPGSADNAPSPNKRPRVEGGNAFNGQPMGPGRTQGMPQQPMGATAAGQANQMMLAGGMNPGNQFNDFAQQANVQQKSLEVYAQNLAEQQRTAMSNQMMPKGMPAGVQGSPMNQQGLDGQPDMFAGNAPRGMPGTAPPGSNHALQDYQMQLMLLEQQNKKRLLMARQEQDNMGQGGPHGQAGAPGFAPQTMSPQGSRAGPSPNPNDQMKRGTPKLNQQGLPGSPMPDAAMQQNRNSPVPNFDHPMPPGVPPQYYGPQGMAAGPNPMMMRQPPSSHPGAFNGQFNPQQMEAMRNGAMPNGQWRGPPQMMQNQGQQPGGMNPGQPRGNPMPPPPAPPAGEQPRTQEPSPSQPAPAPPTPQQANKPNPKKKDTRDNKKKPAKKNAAAAGQTPATEAAEAPTPTPSTPITPMNPASFKQQQNGQGQQHPPQPQAQPAAQPQAPQVQPPPMDGVTGFGSMGDEGGLSEINFEALVGGDPSFENFDFDSFLHNDDGNNLDFSANFNFAGDGVEAGGGEI